MTQWLSCKSSSKSGMSEQLWVEDCNLVSQVTASLILYYDHGCPICPITGSFGCCFLASTALFAHLHVSVLLRLRNPLNGARLGIRTQATITIASSDDPSGVFGYNSQTLAGFMVTNPSVASGSSSITLTIDRSAGVNENVTVSLCHPILMFGVAFWSCVACCCISPGERWYTAVYVLFCCWDARAESFTTMPFVLCGCPRSCLNPSVSSSSTATVFKVLFDVFGADQSRIHTDIQPTQGSVQFAQGQRCVWLESSWFLTIFIISRHETNHCSSGLWLKMLGLEKAPCCDLSYSTHKTGHNEILSHVSMKTFSCHLIYGHSVENQLRTSNIWKLCHFIFPSCH